MLVSTAYAQAATPPAAGFDPMAFVPLVLIFIVFYFLLIRPQQKKMKEHKSMIDALRRGDRIVTAGGIIGTVTRVTGDDEAVVEIAEGVRVRVVRGTISTVLAKPEPGKADRTKDDKTRSDSDAADEGGDQPKAAGRK